MTGLALGANPSWTNTVVTFRIVIPESPAFRWLLYSGEVGNLVRSSATKAYSYSGINSSCPRRRTIIFSLLRLCLPVSLYIFLNMIGL